jgi:hypothetical protein
MQVPDIARLAVAIMATLVFIGFSIRTNDDWKGMSRGWKVTRLGVAVLIFIGAWGTVEIMTIEPPVPLGTRNILLPIGLSLVGVGLWLIRKDHAPMTGGWIRASEVAEILADIEGDEADDPCHNTACLRARTRLRTKIAHASHRDQI